MYRSLSACFILVAAAAGHGPVSAQNSLMTPATIKQLPAAAPFTDKEATPGSIVPPKVQKVVRTHSITSPPEVDFSVPQGALYTTSDECA